MEMNNCNKLTLFKFALFIVLEAVSAFFISFFIIHSILQYD